VTSEKLLVIMVDGMCEERSEEQKVLHLKRGSKLFLSPLVLDSMLLSLRSGLLFFAPCPILPSLASAGTSTGAKKYGFFACLVDILPSASPSALLFFPFDDLSSSKSGFCDEMVLSTDVAVFPLADKTPVAWLDWLCDEHGKGEERSDERKVVSYDTGKPNGEERSDELKASEANEAKSSSRIG